MEAALLASIVAALLIGVLAYSAAANGDRNGGLFIAIAGGGFLAILLAIMLSYHYWWSSATPSQQRELASALPTCPEVRRQARDNIQAGLSQGAADRLIADCAREALVASAQEEGTQRRHSD